LNEATTGGGVGLEVLEEVRESVSLARRGDEENRVDGNLEKILFFWGLSIGANPREKVHHVPDGHMLAHGATTSAMGAMYSDELLLDGCLYFKRPNRRRIARQECVTCPFGNSLLNIEVTGIGLQPDE
jgi:hypothetical protein